MAGDAEIFRELLRRLPGKTDEQIGEVIGLSQQRVNRARKDLEEERAVNFHDSTRERIAQKLQQIGAFGDYERGVAETLDWFEQKIGERRAAVLEATSPLTPEEAADAVRAADDLGLEGGDQRKRRPG